MDDFTESRPRDILWFRDSPFMRNRPFEVVGIGSPDWMKPRMIDRPNGTTDYLFMYFPTAIRVRHEDVLRDFPPGCFFLWTPGNRHNFGHPDQPWCHWWLHAKGEFVERAIRDSSIPCNVPIQLETPGLFPGLLRPLYDELNESVQPDHAILEARFTLLVRLLDRALHPRPAPGHIPERIARVMRRMTDDPAAGPATLPELARIAGLSVSRFSAEFRATTGMPPIRFLLEKNSNLQRISCATATCAFRRRQNRPDFTIRSIFRGSSAGNTDSVRPRSDTGSKPDCCRDATIRWNRLVRKFHEEFLAHHGKNTPAGVHYRMK